MFERHLNGVRTLFKHRSNENKNSFNNMNMKKALIIILSFVLFSCTNESPVEMHQCTLISTNCITENVIMYDQAIKKEVTIRYTRDLFRISLIGLLTTRAGVTFSFYYQDGNYYSM